MPEKPRASRGRKAAVMAAGLFLVLLTACLIYSPQIMRRWTAPLGPALDLPTYTPIFLVQAAAPKATQPAPSGLQDEEPSPSPAALETQPAAETPTQSPMPEPLCGGPPVMTVLAVGADSGDDYLYGLGDVIRIVRVDFVTPKISVLSVPRDLWVELPPGIVTARGEVITHGKLNQSYFYGGPGMGYYDGPGDGPGLLARTLDLNFGLRADHYGAVNMAAFVRIVDAVGGIDIYLPEDVDGTPVDDRTEDMGLFHAGLQHFNGDEALRFSRIRKRYNDFIRMDHQNMVLCALRKKALSPSVLPKIPKIIAALQGAILTDLSLEQISQMACLLPHLQRENLLFTNLPDEIMTPGQVYSPMLKNKTFVLQADFNVIRDYARQFMDGTWPTQPEEPTCR